MALWLVKVSLSSYGLKVKQLALQHHLLRLIQKPWSLNSAQGSARSVLRKASLVCCGFPKYHSCLSLIVPFRERLSSASRRTYVYPPYKRARKIDWVSRGTMKPQVAPHSPVRFPDGH